MAMALKTICPCGHELTALALGTPLLFDFGVYLTVMGVVLSILLAVIEETQ